MAFLIVIYIEEIKRGQALMRERLKEFKDLLDEERILHAKMEAYYFKWNLQEELEGIHTITTAHPETALFTPGVSLPP